MITTDEASLAFAVLNMDMGSPEIEAAIFQINRNKKNGVPSVPAIDTLKAS